MPSTQRLEAMLERGRDDALLRYGLGSAYLADGVFDKASEHLRAAVAHDSNYSAAWKLLGKACVGANDLDGAIEAYQTGITVAEARGDAQAAKEMTVFLKRAIKQKG